MSARDPERMGVDPLRDMEARSYPQTVISRPDVPAAEAESTEEAEPSKRQWTPRPKHPDDPDDRTRHSYYVGDWVHNRLKTLARQYRVPVSHLARYLLRDGIQRLENGDLELQPQEVVTRKLD